MKTNNHNAKQAQPKMAKSKPSKEITKIKPKRVKNKPTAKAAKSTGLKTNAANKSSDVEVIKTAKSGLHERNAHRGRYDFKKLIAAEPQLKSFVIKNPKRGRLNQLLRSKSRQDAQQSTAGGAL